MLSVSPISAAALPPPAVGYAFLRFVAESPEGTHVTEVTFLNGDVEYPRIGFGAQDTRTVEARLVGRYPFNSQVLFDHVADTDVRAFLRTRDGVDPAITLGFGYVAYPTAVRIARPSWSPLPSFRIEGAASADGPWEVVYDAPDGLTDEDFPVRDGQVVVGTFAFGTDPVVVDVTPPAAPSPRIASLTSNSVELAWDPVADDGSVAGYAVSVDGVPQGFTADPSFAREFTLEPETTYEATVTAYDAEFNASTPASITFTTPARPAAQGYPYLRFVVTDFDLDEPGQRGQLSGVKWIMGEREFPLEPLTSSTGSPEVTISSTTTDLEIFDGPYKMYDEQDATHWYVGDGEEATLYFADAVVYPTGLRVETYNYVLLRGFRAEGSTDGETWDLLFEADGLTADDYVREAGDPMRRGTFDFGVELPDDIDATPPAPPSGLAVEERASTYARVSWSPADDGDGVGVSAYRISVNGERWSSTAATETTVYGLSPETTYEIAVTAFDRLGNRSDLSAPLAVTTGALAPAVGGMEFGVGMGGQQIPRYRAGVDFAAEWANYAEANPFDPAYLEEIAHFRVLRFMDLLPTNNNWIVDWADRRQPDDPDQDDEPNYRPELEVIRRGMAIEWMIKLCNVNRSDLWINVPHAASDDYIAQLAALVERYLDPELDVYVEYSNEVFAGFGAERFATARGRELGFDRGDFQRYDWFGDAEYARFRYYVHRSVYIFDAFTAAFGDDHARVQKVLSGWNGQPGMTRVHLEALGDPAVNPSGTLPDHYAVAPYFGIKAAVDDQNALRIFREEIDKTVAKVAAHYTILAEDGRGIPLITYEAGQHFTRGGEVASRLPQMHQAYMEYLDGLAPYLKLFTHFVDFAPYRQGFAWGLKEYIGQPDLTAYKYRAIKDWIRVNGDNVDSAAPVVLEQPVSVDLAEGSGATITVTAIGAQPMTFRWFRNGEEIAGQTGPSLALGQQPLSADGDVYTFVATNSGGSTAGDSIVVRVAASPKATIRRGSGPIAVDGVVDDAWASADVYDLANVNLGAVDGDADLVADFRALWNDDYLYVLVDVADDALVGVPPGGAAYNFDGVEIYVDVDNAKAEGYDPNDRQVIFAYGAEGLAGGSGSLPIAGAVAAQADRPGGGGYVTEIALAWSDLGIDPAAGNFLGFDVMVVDNDTPGGDRDGKLAWWATEDLSYARPADFGTALLTDADATPTRDPAAASSLSTAIRLFPNPARETLSIGLPADARRGGEVTVTLVDALGREVRRLTRDPAASLTLPVDDLAGGLYRVTVTQETHRATRTIVIGG